MTSTAKPFEPITQFDQTLTELEEHMQRAAAAIERMQWLKGKIADDLDAASRERETVEIYTEEQAAGLLQIKPSQLASLRRRHNFEHINFGSVICYNRSQITAICDAYRREQDSIAQFIEERCQTIEQARKDVPESMIEKTYINPADYRVSNKDLYAAYKEFCTANGEYLRSHRRLTQNMHERGFQQGRQQSRYWEGVKLISTD